MFGKLREKLKGALSTFSKKTQQEAKEIPAQEVEHVDEPVAIEPEQVKKEQPKPKAKKKPEPKKRGEPKESDEPEDEEDVHDEALTQEQIALADSLVEDAAKASAPEVPSTFEAGQMQYVADTKKIEEMRELEQKSQEPAAPTVTSEKKKFRLFKKKKVESAVEERQPDSLVGEKKQTTQVSEQEAAEKKNFFAKATQALTTRKISAEKFEDLFWDLEIVLLEHNVSVEIIERMKLDLKEVLVDKPLPRNVMQKIEQTLRATLEDILSHDPIDLVALSSEKKPLVIALFGINGAGKTTSVAKLAHYFKKQGKSCVLAACDTFRAAAIQQIEEHAQKLDVKLIKHDYGSDAAAVAFDAVAYAKKHDIDVVLLDTAGRLHSNKNLMNELEKLIRVAKPDLNIFVGESITGNDCIEQAVEFNKLVTLDGAILTKADVDEKGGAPLSISYMIKKPILFLGVGQTYDDLDVFDKEKIISHLGF